LAGAAERAATTYNSRSTLGIVNVGDVRQVAIDDRRDVAGEEPDTPARAATLHLWIAASREQPCERGTPDARSRQIGKPAAQPPVDEALMDVLADQELMGRQIRSLGRILAASR
jgi:hypothetical protein